MHHPLLHVLINLALIIGSIALLRGYWTWWRGYLRVKSRWLFAFHLFFFALLIVNLANQFGVISLF